MGLLALSALRMAPRMEAVQSLVTVGRRVVPQLGAIGARRVITPHASPQLVVAGVLICPLVLR